MSDVASKGIFITATGTDVGKTYVTGLLAKLLHENGDNVGYYKAALSGAEWIDGELVAGDSAYVAKMGSISKQPNSMVSYIYETAVSPHLAAKLEHNPIEMNVIKQDFIKVKQEFDYVLVEGSGGIVCPLRLDEKQILLTDVIKALDLDCILVASAELGTINSVVLTVSYAKSLGITIKGIILNNFNQESTLHQDNKTTIEQLTGIPILACVAFHCDSIDLDASTLKNAMKEISL